MAAAILDMFWRLPNTAVQYLKTVGTHTVRPARDGFFCLSLLTYRRACACVDVRVVMAARASVGTHTVRPAKP